jgi:hypothetical protein
MTEDGKTKKVKVYEITENIAVSIETCLGRNLLINREKQKVFIGSDREEKSFAVFVTSNKKPEEALLRIYISPNAEEPDLSEAMKELPQILSEKYPFAKEIVSEIEDNDGIIKQAMTGFSVKKRIIVYGKELHGKPKSKPEKPPAKIIKKREKLKKHLPAKKQISESRLASLREIARNIQKQAD